MGRRAAPKGARSLRGLRAFGRLSVASLSDFGLEPRRCLRAPDARPTFRYDAEAARPPWPHLAGSARRRLRVPPAVPIRSRRGADSSFRPRSETRRSTPGLLLSAVDLRLAGVTEGSGRFLSREGSNLWIKTADGRHRPAGQSGASRWRGASGTRSYAPDEHADVAARATSCAGTATGAERCSRSGSKWRRTGRSFERDSAWTEWVRRVPGPRACAANGAGGSPETRSASSPSPNAARPGARSKCTFQDRPGRRSTLQAIRFAAGGRDARNALHRVERVRGASGRPGGVRLPRARLGARGGALCQNGAFGMALAGVSPTTSILRHYYTGIADRAPPRPSRRRATPSAR